MRNNYKGTLENYSALKLTDKSYPINAIEFLEKFPCLPKREYSSLTLLADLRKHSQCDLTLGARVWWVVRMGARVVEGTGLENRHTSNRIVGSNPTPSANFLGILRLLALVFFIYTFLYTS